MPIAAPKVSDVLTIAACAASRQSNRLMLFKTAVRCCSLANNALVALLAAITNFKTCHLKIRTQRVRDTKPVSAMNEDAHPSKAPQHYTCLAQAHAVMRSTGSKTLHVGKSAEKT